MQDTANPKLRRDMTSRQSPIYGNTVLLSGSGQPVSRRDGLSCPICAISGATPRSRFSLQSHEFGQYRQSYTVLPESNLPTSATVLRQSASHGEVPAPHGWLKQSLPGHGSTALRNGSHLRKPPSGTFVFKLLGTFSRAARNHQPQPVHLTAQLPSSCIHSEMAGRKQSEKWDELWAQMELHPIMGL